MLFCHHLTETWGGGIGVGGGEIGGGGSGGPLHFTSLHFYHRGHGCRIWPFRRNLWRIWRGAVMTLFMFFKRSSLQAHEDSSETPLTPQKRMCSETRPSIGTPSFILIAIPFFFSPPVSSYFFSTPPPWVNGRKSSRELTGKQLRFKLKSQQRMFSSLTWHPFSCTRPTNTQKRETGKKKYACLKKKNKRERLRERKERDGPFWICVFLFIISWLGASSFWEKSLSAEHKAARQRGINLLCLGR